MNTGDTNHAKRPKNVYFVYDNINKGGHLPKVLIRLISELNEHGGGGVHYYAHDLKHCYECTPTGDALQKIDKPPRQQSELYVILPWGTYLKLLALVIKARMNHQTVVVWPWGMFCRQQWLGNWNEGRTPLWLKKIASKTIKLFCDTFCNGYLVFSRSEIEDSGLGNGKCVQFTMGRPPTPLMTATAGGRGDPETFQNKHITYIGRGMWKEKGIENIVQLAASEFGSSRDFHFFISSKSKGFEQSARDANASNLHWHDDVRGADLLPWLRRSAAFITVNHNPIALQSSMEALCTGTPIIVFREAMMDGFKVAFETAGLPGSVHIIEENDLHNGSVPNPDMTPDMRARLSEMANSIMSPETYSAWFNNWAKTPVFPANYYEDWAKCFSHHEK